MQSDKPTSEFTDILWHPTKIYGPKVFLLTKIKPEYSYILYNLTYFPGPLVCWFQCILYHIFKLMSVLYNNNKVGATGH